MEDKLPLVGQAAVPVAQHRCAHRPRGAGQGDDIHLGVGVHDHLLAGRNPFNGLDLIPQQGRRLKIQPFRGRFHLFPQLLDDVLLAVSDHPQCALDRLVVGFTADLAAAHRHALADVGVQAGAPLAEVPGKFPVAAGQQKTVLGHLHHLPHREGGGERADIVGIVIVLLQRRRDPRPGAFGHLHIAVALVILEQDVVLRGVGLDLAGFQHQRLKLALTDNHIKGEGVGDHLGDLGVVGHPLPEILRHPGLQPLGLADIDDGIAFVPDDVYPRQQRQHTGLAVEFSFCHESPLQNTRK